MHKIIPILLLWLAFFDVKAQAGRDSAHVCVVKMKDGKQITGKLVTINERELTIKTDSLPEMVVSRLDIEKIDFRSLKGYREQSSITNNSRTHYYIGPSGFMLKRSEAYFQNSYFLFNMFNYGITDNFTLGGGCEMVSLVMEKPIVVLAPKVGIEISDHLHLAAGWISAFLIGWSEKAVGAGLLYAMGTIGSQTRNVSIGAGWGNLWAQRMQDRSEAPFATLSTRLSLAKRLAFVSENWLKCRDEMTTVSFTGLRLSGDRMSVGLGNLLVYNEPTGLSGIPYIDMTLSIFRK